MDLTQIKALLFDKDGTLIDIQKTWGQWAHSLLKDLSEGDDALFMALCDEIAFQPETLDFLPGSIAIAGTPDDVAGALAPMLPAQRSRSELVAYIIQTSLDAPPVEVLPLGPFLDGLRDAGFSVGLATNDGEAPARKQMDVLGVSDKFDMIIGCDSGHGAKPGPGQVLAFASEMRVAPSDVLMIGDSLHDLMAGRAAGARTLGVLTGYATERDLAPFADAVLPDIGAMRDWLKTG